MLAKKKEMAYCHTVRNNGTVNENLEQEKEKIKFSIQRQKCGTALILLLFFKK